MKKLAIAILSSTALSVTALAQGTSTTTSASSTVTPAENLSSISTAQVGAAPPSKWGGSILFIYDKAARVKSLDENAKVSEFDTQTHFSANYKLGAKDTLAIVQRLFYSKSVVGNSTLDQAQLGNLRIQETHIGNLFGGDFALLSRLTLPTALENRRDFHQLGALTFIPDVSWGVTPKLTLGYSGYAAGSFYDDANRPTETAGVTRFVQGAAATTFTVINQGYVSYSITDKLSVSQALGLSTTSRNSKKDLTNLQEISRTFENASTLSYAPIKHVALSLGINQSAAIMEGSSDPVNGKPLDYEKDLVLFARDQTTYELTGSVSF